VPLVELASRRVLLPDTKVELSAQWLHNLGTELFEHPPPSSAELFAIQNLVEHYGSSGHIDGANPRSLPVLLIRNDNPILIHALPSSYSPIERVLPDMGENVSVGAEVVEYLLQFVWRAGMPTRSISAKASSTSLFGHSNHAGNNSSLFLTCP
jgi:hypothetical protein